MTKRYWFGSTPARCDLSGIEITDCFVDGATKMGPWAKMHPKAHDLYGLGLGQGLGQMYRKQPDGRWLKVGG